MFIAGVKNNAPDFELDRIKRAIENFTIDKGAAVFDAGHLIDAYGSYAPPKVLGSCGSSSSTTVMDFQSKLNPGSDKFGERTFEYPECGKTNIRPKDKLIKNCQHCNSSNVVC
jgi:hypothetical protein